jgi:hypothetical protein
VLAARVLPLKERVSRDLEAAGHDLRDHRVADAHVVDLVLLADLAEARVVAVLLAPARVASGRL